MSNFYIGVVEDRHDPKTMGRVRVRVLGLHSDDRVDEVPIDSLPWSMVMYPVTQSSSATGISQLVEGTWVLVMYYDQYLQDPIVIGALPPTLVRDKPDYTKGFSDPFGVYPKWADGSSNTTLVGKPETYAEHPVYNERARTQIPSVPTAKRYKVDTVAEDADEAAYERSEWAELNLRGDHGSQYPYNSVNEYEGGMLEEFDSTPGNQRVTRTHPSGTYDEILVDGTKTVKIVGTGYEITLKNKNIYIKGDLNMTVDGSMTQLVKGDYTLEVGGNYYQTIGVSRETKILGNDVMEVGQDVSININTDYYVRCGNTHSLTVGADKLEVIAGTYQKEVGVDYSSIIGGKEVRIVTGDFARICLANLMEVTSGSHKIETKGAITIDTDNSLDIVAGTNMNADVSGAMTYDVTGAIDINGATIDLN